MSVNFTNLVIIGYTLYIGEVKVIYSLKVSLNKIPIAKMFI